MTPKPVGIASVKTPQRPNKNFLAFCVLFVPLIIILNLAVKTFQLSKLIAWAGFLVCFGIAYVACEWIEL